MKVICAGMSKTGTKSMHFALELLGYDHDYLEALEIYGNEYDVFCDKGWSIEEFRHMYENVDAAVDAPVYYFWEELVEAFPDAKVILMVRDDDETWYRSMREQNRRINGSHMWFYHLFGSSGWRAFVNFCVKPAFISCGGIKVGWFDPYFRLSSALLMKQTYRRHIAHVKNSCPKDKLLVYNCKEGWGPLCEFLGKPVPSEPFPRINVNSQLADFMWESEYFKRESKAARVNCAVACFALALATWAFSKRKIS